MNATPTPIGGYAHGCANTLAISAISAGLLALRVSSVRLSPVVAASSACPPGACSTPGCPLPRGLAEGFCGPCARVHAGTLALCERLLARDLARLEWRAPGLTAAAQTALRCAAFVTPDTTRENAPGRGGRWPARGDMAALEALVVELRERGLRS